MQRITIERLLKVHEGKLETANDFNNHTEALQAEGAVSALQTLLIYYDEENPDAQKIINKS